MSVCVLTIWTSGIKQSAPIRKTLESIPVPQSRGRKPEEAKGPFDGAKKEDAPRRARKSLVQQQRGKVKNWEGFFLLVDSFIYLFG